MIENPALSMLKWREGKRAALANRVEEATTLSHADAYLESLVASGVVLTSMEHFGAQKKKALVASLSYSEGDCSECGDDCFCGVGGDGVYEVRKGKVRRVSGHE